MFISTKKTKRFLTANKGLYSNVEEVRHVVKNAKHDLIRVYTNAENDHINRTNKYHTIIKITTRTGEVYALDMTGAQYGWTECIVPWEVYVESRVEEVIDVFSFGGIKVWCNMDTEKRGGRYKWVCGIKVLFAQVVDGAVMLWQKGNMLTTNLFRLPEQDFQKKQASLIDSVEELLQKEKASQESQGSFETEGFKDGFEREQFFGAAALRVL